MTMSSAAGLSLPPGKNIKPLTGIRFFAAMWVLVFHYKDEIPQGTPVVNFLWPIVMNGHYAVPMFFLLSGFILSHTYFGRYRLSRHADFVYLRFARLWPVHVASIIGLLLYLCVLALFGGPLRSDSFPFQQLPAELAMIRCWYSETLIWNYPAWSIHAEWFAYLFLFPVAFLAFRNASRTWVLLSAIVVLLITHSLLPVKVLPGKCGDIVFLFLAGSALYRLRVVLDRVPGQLAASLGLVLLLSALFYGADTAVARLTVHVAFALLIFGLSYEGGILGRFLSWRPVVYGGAISYSIYMTHAVVLKVFAAARHRWYSDWEGPAFGTFLFAIALSLAAASLTYRFIEVPCNKALRRRSPSSCFASEGKSKLA